jgi:predicted CoA-binding protein
VTLTDVPGTIDLVLVFGAPGDLQRLLEEAAAKRVDGVWFLQQGPGRLARDPARRLGLTLIVDSDVVRRHRGRLGR